MEHRSRSSRRLLLSPILVMCSVLSCPAAEHLENPPTVTLNAPVGWNQRFFRHLPTDAREMVEAPAHWGTWNWVEAAGVVGAGVLLYQEDARIDRWVQRHRSRSRDRMSTLVKPFGSTYLVLGLGGLALASPFVEDQRVTRTALLGSESLLFALGGYEVLQIAVNRSRPSQGADRDTASGPGIPARKHSFPSGHATASFALASVVATEWQDVPLVPEAAYGLATLVSISRINDHAHWSTDVLAGALLGIVMGRSVEALHQSQHVTVSPWCDGHGRGVDICWRW